MSGRTIDRKAPAARMSIFAENWRSWDWMATVIGWESGPAKISATSMSFQDHRNWKIASEAMAGMAMVATEVATEALAVAGGVREMAKEGRALRDVLAATTLDNAKEQAKLLDSSASSMLARAEQLNAPLAVMTVKSVTRRVA